MIEKFLRLFAARRRALVIREVEAFKMEEIAKVSQNILAIKHNFADDLEKLTLQHAAFIKKCYEEMSYTAKKCADDMKAKEHEFHTEESEKRATLKILAKEIEFMEAKHRMIQEVVDAEDKITFSMGLLLNEKQSEIDKLSKTLENLTT